MFGLRLQPHFAGVLSISVALNVIFTVKNAPVKFVDLCNECSNNDGCNNWMAKPGDGETLGWSNLGILKLGDKRPGKVEQKVGVKVNELTW